MGFLKAEWKNLAIANFEVNPHLLKNYIPRGTFLDLWEGRCYLSLVGFMFENTRILGMKIPFHVDFEEVNLRFYVKCYQDREWKRGVVFIKEIVPKKAISMLANALYHEHYETMPMKHSWETRNDKNFINYSWKTKGNWQSFGIESSAIPKAIERESEAEFITEHYWGFTKVDEATTYEYEVVRPRWEVYEVLEYRILVDFELVYGVEFKNLNFARPQSVMLAAGSEIEVENKRVLQ